MLVSIKNLTVMFAENTIIKEVDAVINENERIGLVGVNGAGKSTLINALCGRLEAEAGAISRKSGLRTGYLEQNSGLEAQKTIIEELRSVFKDIESALKRLIVLQTQMQTEQNRSLAAEYDEIVRFIEANDGYNTDVKIKKILNGMGFADKAADMEISKLSGGEKTRLAIAKLLLEEPELLILDEPTNHLDFKTLMWLEEYISGYRGAVLVVSHDRFFLDKTVEKIWEIEDKKLKTYKGNYSAFKEQKERDISFALKEYEKQSRQIEAMEDYAQRNMARASTATRAKSRINLLSHMEIMEKPRTSAKKPAISFEFERNSVLDVLCASELEIAVGSEKKVLIKPFSMNVKRGEKIAVIGENGTGKSTLMAALYKQLNIASGGVSWGKNVFLGYYDQENRDMDENNAALEEIMKRYPMLSQYQARSYLGRVLLSAENVYKRVRELSGGERAKLGFALLMAGKFNTLLLDEPTNHLDLQTRECLEKALQEFEGTLVFVSHDRYFINAVADRIYEIENESITMYEGGFSSCLEAKKQRETAEIQAVKTPSDKMSAKKRRSLEAEKRKNISEVERAIEEAEKAIAEAEKAIAENPSDHALLAECCAKIEELKKSSEELMEKWVQLSEE